MTSLVLFTIVLVIVGGLIAWLGDWLGTRIGKKRLSIFGLRPRHTATALTIASGIGIALVTLATLIAYDYNVRRALLHGQEIFDTNKKLKQQNLAQQKEIAAGQAQIAAEQAKLSPVLSQLAASRGALYQSQQTLRERQTRLDAAQATLTAAQTTLGTTHASLSAAQERVRAARLALDSAHTHVAAAQGDVHRLSQQGAALAAQNARLHRQGLALAGRVTASRQNLIYGTGQEAGRTVIAASQPVTTVERELTDFLARLGNQAARRGGGIGKNGRAVTIAVPADAGEYRPLGPEEERAAVRALAQNIAGAGSATGSVVVVAQVTYNAFVGEQSDLELHPYDNVLVYKKDAVVASETIDGSRPDADIVSALQAFLTGRVRPAALHEGLIPQTDPTTGRPLVGAIDQTALLALVRQITTLGGPVRVTASVSEDVYSVGPLHLHLSAAPAGAS